jgi:hypothetical protein
MQEDLNDIERIIWMEKRFGPLSKSIPGGFNMEKVDQIEGQLISLLQRYKTELLILGPIPRIRMWAEEDKVNFLFFDKETGKRILLGQWLSNKNEAYYEH